MSRRVIQLYDYLRAHRSVRLVSLLLLTVVLAILVTGQKYKEDISDFLPLGDKYHRAMTLYQDISGANRLFVLFQLKDTTVSEPDSLVSAMEAYERILLEQDTAGMASGLTTQVDLESLGEIAGFVYSNIPYFLTERDYAHFDSLLSQQDFVAQQLSRDKQLLMFPVSSLFSDNLQRDPLNLFTPVVSRLQSHQHAMGYELYEGYVFSPDMSRSMMMLTSPYGSSETEHNAQLVQLLEAISDTTTHSHSQVDIQITGGPAIAVGNSRQIKQDSLLSVVLAVILIITFLYYSFRNTRNILLIVLSIAWGWLFAMGGLALVHDRISVIVIGISSIILGIAVNYPLHLIAHFNHTPDVRTALKEIVMPLLVGNITTVGAFLALAPLPSQALSDLGLFSSFLLIGTILFVLIYLPHLAKAKTGQSTPALINRIGAFKLENKRWLVTLVIALTCVFGFFSMGTTFDVNMNHINYMTDEQRADMRYLEERLTPSAQTKTLYVVYEGHTMEEALDHCLSNHPQMERFKSEGDVESVSSCAPLLCSRKEQAVRLKRWRQFVETHHSTFDTTLREEARRAGFAPDSFDEFFAILSGSYEVQPPDYFQDLQSSVFASHLNADSVEQTYSVIDQVIVSNAHFSAVKDSLDRMPIPGYVFDVEGMNSSIATTLSDNFNYIGWACGLIVFLFLWFSLGSIELALLSFLPMAVSWVWIMGIMSVLDIHFNVVNVILATFIFGQGDDYTIFMTEGCQYEYAYRKKMISSYKNSIIISALIMFFGIGTLIFAKHPALHSLAQVTIIGMFTVVFMAYLLPPLLFKWLVKKGGEYRKRPLTLRRLLTRKGDDDAEALVLDRYRYKGYDILRSAKQELRRHASDEPISDAGGRIVIEDSGYGAYALLLALRHPNRCVVAYEADADKRRVATYSAEGVVSNLTILSAQNEEHPNEKI